MELQHRHPAPKVPSCFLPLMSDQGMNSKGRFGALFCACLTLARLIAIVMCAIMFAPFALLLAALGFDAAHSGDGMSVVLGVLFFAWGAGGVIGLIGYAVAALRWTRQFNRLCRWRFSSMFALSWGCAAAAPLVIPVLYSGFDLRETPLVFFALFWLDAIGLLVFGDLDSSR